MINKHYKLFSRYYNATVGRFYNKEQRRKILRLFMMASGIDETTAAYQTVCNTVDTVEAQKITNLIESKNYQMISKILEDDEDIHSAARALRFAFQALTDNGMIGKDMSPLAWVASVRCSDCESAAARMERAIMEYAFGNITDAIEALEHLLNDGDLNALELLVCVHAERGANEDAYYYLCLMHRVFTLEFGLQMPASHKDRMQLLQNSIPAERKAAIEQEVCRRPVFMNLGKNAGKPTIGFLNTEERRFAYEHK